MYQLSQVIDAEGHQNKIISLSLLSMLPHSHRAKPKLWFTIQRITVKTVQKMPLLKILKISQQNPRNLPQTISNLKVCQNKKVNKIYPLNRIE